MSSRFGSLSLSNGLPLLAAGLLAAAGAFPQISGCAAADEELGHGGLTTTGATSVTSTSGTSTTSGTGTTGSGVTTGSTTTTTSSTGEGGGTSSSSTGQGGAGGAGGAGSGGGGGAGGAAGTGTVLLLAGGGPSVLGGGFHTGAGWTTATVAGGATDKGPALVIDATGQGVGVVRSTANAGELRATVWAAGSWSALAPVAMAVTTRDTPHAVAVGSAAFVVFHGDDFKHYLAVHDGAQWSPTAEPVGGAGGQSFGPSPAAIGAAGASPVLAFAGNDHDLYDQTRSGGVWGPAIGHGLGDLVDVTPAIAAPTMGPNLMIVLVRKTDSALLYTVRNGVNWTMPIAIANTSSTAAPALLALPAGELLLAYRGPANKLFTSRYTPGSVPPWSAPAQLGMDTLASVPALAPGIDGALAELAYVDAGTGAAFHARLTGAAWSAPVLVGGAGMTDVAIASAP